MRFSWNRDLGAVGTKMPLAHRTSPCFRNKEVAKEPVSKQKLIPANVGLLGVKRRARHLLDARILSLSLPPPRQAGIQEEVSFQTAFCLGS